MMVRRLLEEGWSVAAVASAFEISTHRPQVARPFPQRRRCRPGEPQLGAAPGRQKADDTSGGHDHPSAARVPHDWRRASRRGPTAPAPASLFTSIPRSSRASGASALPRRSAAAKAKPQVGNSCTSQSTMRPGSPSSRSWPTKSATHRLPGPGAALVQETRHSGRARDDRQRRGPSLASLWQGLRLRHLRTRPHTSRNNGSTTVVVIGATKGPLRQWPG
jgi:hypothetical protein